MDVASAIVAHGPCRWDAACFETARQRLSRIAQQRPVVFLEEAVRVGDSRVARWELQRPSRGLLVARARTPEDVAWFDGERRPRLVDMTRRLLAWRGIGAHVAWLFAPAALPLATSLVPECIVYDGLDRAASGQGGELEPELLRAASVVLMDTHLTDAQRAGSAPDVCTLLAEVDRALELHRGTRARRRSIPVPSPALRRASA